MRRTPVLGRLAAVRGRPIWSSGSNLNPVGVKVKLLLSLVIALASISRMRRCGDPKSERPENASGSSVSGLLLVMCVLGACGLVGTENDTRASRQGRPGSVLLSDRGCCLLLPF